MTALRPLSRPPIAAGKVKGAPPKLAFLALDRLRINDAYQREITRKGLSTIASICAGFNWSRFAPLVVARAPGGEGFYAIIDGQHRATAAVILGLKTVPCAIVEASESEQAGIFAAVNGNVTPVTILQLFKAARAAGAEWALQIDDVCTRAGLTALVYPKAKSEIRPFETMAIGTLRKCIIRFGVDEVAAALKDAARHNGADEPGFWSSRAIDAAIAEYRTTHGKRPEPVVETTTTAARIRELYQRGHTRFAIQAALRVKLADIEAAIQGAK